MPSCAPLVPTVPDNIVIVGPLRTIFLITLFTQSLTYNVELSGVIHNPQGKDRPEANVVTTPACVIFFIAPEI